MKKNFRSLFVAMMAMVAVGSLSAQEVGTKVAEEEKAPVTTYHRSGLAIVTMMHKDSQDRIVDSAMESLRLGDKYNVNYVGAEYFDVDFERSDSLLLRPARNLAVRKVVDDNDLAKKSISYCLMRKGDGSMSTDRILSRGNYDATDVDVTNAQATKIGVAALEENSFALLDLNFIMAIDYTSIKKTYDSDNKHTGWSATCEARVYKVNFSEQDLNYIDGQCWIYEDDDDAAISKKIDAYNSWSPRLTEAAIQVATGSSSISSDETIEDALHAAYYNAVTACENHIEEWAVKAPVEEIKPIRSKIGTKEGLKNLARYYAYEYLLDDNGKTIEKRRGIVRATKVTNNSQVADGNMPASEFYQIAGFKNVEQGNLLKQRNDLGMSLGVGYNTIDIVSVSLDYLATMNTAGSSTYGMMTFGGNAYDCSDAFPDGGMGTTVTAFNVGIGVGYGMRLHRAVEFVPNAMVKGDYLATASALLDDTESSITDNLAYGASVGLKINVNVAYPVQVYAGVDYTLYVSKGGSGYWDGNTLRGYGYQFADEMMDYANASSRSGLGITFGVRYSF